MSQYRPIAQVVEMLQRDPTDKMQGMNVVYCAFEGEGGAGLLGLLVSDRIYRFNGQARQIVHVSTSPVPKSGIGYITKATKGKGHTMQRTSHSTKLNEAIADFEEKLGRLVDTDDSEALLRWVEGLRGSFGALDAMICTQRQRIHEKLFREIAAQDASELEHIRELRDGDEQIKNFLDCVKSHLIVFSMHASSEVEARIEGQGSEDEPLQDVIDRCNELINWLREQDCSMSVWFAEAFASGAATSEA